MDVPDGNLLAEYVIDVNLSDEMDVARGLEPRTDRIEVSTDIRVAKNDGCSEIEGQREVQHLLDASAGEIAD